MLIAYKGNNRNLIAYKGDHEPIKMAIGDKVMENLSYKHMTVSGTSSVTYESEYKKNLLNMQIQGKTEQNGTPDKDTPVDIVSTGDNGLKVEVRGVNLWSSKRKYSQNLNYEIIDSSTVKIKSNGSNIVPAYCFSIYIGGKGGRYKFSFDLKAKNTPDIATKNTISVYYSNSSSVSTGTLAAQKKMSFDTDTFAHNRFTVAIPEGYQYLGINFYGSTGPATFENYEAVLTNLQCTLTDDYIDFEPYFEPTGVSINTQLCGIDGINDVLQVNYVTKKITNRSVNEFLNLKNCEIGRILVPAGSNYIMYKIENVRTPFYNTTIPYGIGLCSHCIFADYNVYENGGLKEENFLVGLHAGQIVIYIPTSYGFELEYWGNGNYQESTVEALLDWIGDRDIYIQYITQAELLINLTEKLGELLELNKATKNQTNIIEITSDLEPPKLYVKFAKWGENK